MSSALFSLEETFEVPLPIGLVFKAINDVGEIGYCVAGVKQVDVLNDSESDWKIEVRAGFLAQTIKVRGRITERQFPTRLAFTGEGLNVSLSGDIGLECLDPEQTRCRIAIRSEAAGPLAPLVNLVAKTAQQRLVAESILNFRKKLAGQELEGN